jgi:hypothetical protein
VPSHPTEGVREAEYEEVAGLRESASAAYFKVTDEAGRLHYPGLESPPVYGTIFTVYGL